MRSGTGPEKGRGKLPSLLPVLCHLQASSSVPLGHFAEGRLGLTPRDPCQGDRFL